MLVRYSANNSGGQDWLDLQDWMEMEYNGWDVAWQAGGYLPFHAYISVGSLDEAVTLFEEVTGQFASEEGCPCCGPPHSFRKVSDDW